jgi:hypothetical protein
VLRDGALVALGFAAVLGLTVAYFATNGALREYVECTWTRNREYVAERHRDPAWLITLGGLAVTEVARADRAFWLWGSVGLVLLGLFGRSAPGRGLWLLLLLCAGFAFLGGRQFVHYWEPLIVPLSLGNAAAAVWLGHQVARRDRGPLLRAGLVAALLTPWIPPLLNALPYVRMTASDWADLNDRVAVCPYGTRQAAQYLADHTSPGECILNRHACTRLIITYPMSGHYSFAARLRQEFLHDLERHRPRYVLFVNVLLSLTEEGDQRAVFDLILDRVRRDYTAERYFGANPRLPPALMVFRRKGG